MRVNLDFRFQNRRTFVQSLILLVLNFSSSEAFENNLKLAQSVHDGNAL